MQLKTVIISLESLTYAVKAKRTLSKLGITARSVKFDGYGAELGCKHGIEFDSRDLYTVVSALKNAGLEYTVFDGSRK